jgi:hypothetical protein
VSRQWLLFEDEISSAISTVSDTNGRACLAVGVNPEHVTMVRACFGVQSMLRICQF